MVKLVTVAGVTMEVMVEFVTVRGGGGGGGGDVTAGGHGGDFLFYFYL